MRLQVRHRTTYHYSEPVTLGHTEARLMPPDRGRQRRLSFDLQVFPTPKVCHSREDAFGNAVTRFSVETPHEELVVEAHSLMQIAPAEVELPLAGPLTVAEVQKAFRDPQTEAQRLHRLFCLPSAYVPQLPELRDYGLESFHPQRDVVAATKELMERIHDDFQYDPTATEVAT
ncbi:MAG: transglutaminase N-terminal domain-containing protein, partial [Pseudomonadota bacterium]|nr:transglutaminase N-terminal domain-containing protein [Pseudomonadota bacterium]